MTTFTLDTSGAVGPMPSGYDDPENRRGFWSFPRARYAWSDLSPFVQGYVEALMRELDAQRWAAYRASCTASPGYHLPVPLHPQFVWLDPSALALILRDCASFENIATGLGVKKLGATEGRYFWVGRNNGTLQHAWAAAFPPQQPHLSDEGRVCLR